MRFIHRTVLGFITFAAGCGQILDADGPYKLTDSAAGGAGGTGVSVSVSGSSSGGGMGGSSSGMGGAGGASGPTCGNQIVEGPEQCDDGNNVDGDGCDSNCQITACGNGKVTSGEECDDGNVNDGDGCSADCIIEAMCGNGNIDGTELCDDANKIDGDGCDSNCTLTGCGNGITTASEQCDDGNISNGDGCDSNCTLTGCGNGITTAGEQCDDGNSINGDGCDANCSVTACGNGVMTAGEECDDGNLVNNDACSSLCRNTPSSCIGLAENCGPMQNENCCTSYPTTGGTFNRINNSSYPALVSSFRLDRFEVTVGRFRKFVEAYPQNKPVANAGAHPLIAQSGWNDAWNATLPVDQTALRSGLNCSSYSVWSDAAVGKEVMPVNCVQWYEAFAFCAWDNGRLPTESEWNYVGAGGIEQRYYPSSVPPASTTMNASYANYNCYGDGSAAQVCAIEDILGVGSKSPLGDGLWKHADLGGSMKEWTLDVYATPLVNPCNDCANLVAGMSRSVRGGSWGSGSALLANQDRDFEVPSLRDSHLGFRCARGL